MEELLKRLIKTISIQAEIEAMRGANEVCNQYYTKQEFANKIQELREIRKEKDK